MKAQTNRAYNTLFFKKIETHFAGDWLGAFRFFANHGSSVTWDDFMDYGEYLIDIGVLIVEDE